MVVPVVPIEAPRSAVPEGVATTMGLHEAFAMLSFGIARLVTMFRHTLGLG